jgi:phosphatidylglycerophosphate synthase
MTAPLPLSSTAAGRPAWQTAYEQLRLGRDRLLSPIIRLLVRLGVPAAALSAAGVALAGSSIWTLQRAPRLALAAVAGALLCDLLDGAVARRAGSDGARGKLLDQVCDSAVYTALILAVAVHGLTSAGAAVYAAYISVMVVVLALTARALELGERWKYSPQAGFAGHAPKIFLVAALGLYLLDGPNWIEPSLVIGNIVATAIGALLLLRVLRAWPPTEGAGRQWPNSKNTASNGTDSKDTAADRTGFNPTEQDQPLLDPVDLS